MLQNLRRKIGSTVLPNSAEKGIQPSSSQIDVGTSKVPGYSRSDGRVQNQAVTPLSSICTHITRAFQQYTDVLSSSIEYRPGH